MSEKSSKVLLVDDDPAMLRLLAKWLESAGYEVLRAADGKQAIALIETESPQIVVTDWEMPVMDGLELVKWIRSQELPSYIYTIFLTVRSGSGDMIRGLEAGADDFLKKPVDKDELLARLRAGSRVLEMEQRLSILAKTDSMTGLATQRTFYEYLEREWARSGRYHFPLSCVMLDIDFFKRINDTHGHPVGDEVIRQVARSLAENCRASDVICRYGGEEFCILLPETDEAHAAIWAERTRERMSQLRIPVDGKEIGISASLGVAQRLGDMTSPTQFVDAADQALLVAKRSGRDRVVRFQSLSETAAVQSGIAPENDPAALLRGVPAYNVMTTVVASLQQDDTVGTASEYFLRFRISSAPVVNEEGRLVGILSEKDVMAIMLGPKWWTNKIKDVMKRNVVCYEENTPALSIYEFLCRVTIRGAVIVSDGRPTGVITRSSLLRYFTNALAMNKDEQGAGDPRRTEVRMISAIVDSAKPRQRVGQTVQALADEATDLKRRLADQTSELVPCVVGGVSRIQELVNDLLSYSRYADAEEFEQEQSAADDAETSLQTGAAAFLQSRQAAGMTELELSELSAAR